MAFQGFSGFGGDVQRLRQQNLFSQPEESAGYNVDFGMNDLPIMQGAPTYQAPPPNPYQVDFGVPGPAYQSPALTRIGQTPAERAAEMMEAINKIYTPETAETERLSRLLNNFPQRTDPNIWQRIIAGGLAIGKDGQQAAENYISGPYNRDIADWTAQVQPAYNAANLERNANVNERTLAGNILTGMTAQDKLDVDRQKIETNAEIQRQRIEIDRAKANGAKFYERGSRIIAEFPDGSTRDAGPSYNFSPIEVANITADSRMDVTRQQGQNQLAVSQQQGVNQANVANIREGEVYQDPQTGHKWYWSAAQRQYIPLTPGAPPVPTTPINTIGPPARPTAAGSAAETREAEYEKYSEVFNTYDFAQQYMIPPATANARWQLVDAPTDPTKLAEYNQVKSLLGIPMAGGEIPNRPRRTQDIDLGAPPVPRTAAPSAPVGAQQRQVPQGYAEMRDPNGKLGLMRIENVEAATAQGWTRTR